MSGISSLYILDQKGKVIITRAYRADVPFNIHEKFNKKLLEYDETTLKPIILDNEILFYFIKHSNLTFLAVSRRNSNAMMIFAFLYRFQEILTDYFKVLEEESIRDNFVIIYELLDEMMDNGYPQITEVKILQDFIKTEYHALDKEPRETVNPIEVSNLHDGTIHCRFGITRCRFGSKNEIFLDVIEKLNMLVGADGNVIKCEIFGALKIKSMLSGVPEATLCLNAQGRKSKGRATSIEFDNIKFHQCVRLNRFENDRTISFIPPDGDFELMSYRLDMNVKPLFTVECNVEQKSATRINFRVQTRSNYNPKNFANTVTINIPVPTDVQTPQLWCSSGNVTYSPENNSMVWVVKSFRGQCKYTMEGTFALPSIASPDRNNFNRIPISLNFEIPYFTVSGINVRSLNIVEKRGYTASPWVRYITQNGDYFIRMSS